MGAHEAGFTLLEVLIAFAIAALALGALYEGVASGLTTTATATRYELALTRARSHLSGLGDSPAPGEREGDEGDGFHWQTRVAILERAALPRGGMSLLAVEVRVSWPGARGVTLISERVVRIP